MALSLAMMALIETAMKFSIPTEFPDLSIVYAASAPKQSHFVLQEKNNFSLTSGNFRKDHAAHQRADFNSPNNPRQRFQP